MNYTGGKRNVAKARSRDTVGRAQKDHFGRQRMQNMLAKGLVAPSLPTPSSRPIPEFDLEHAWRGRVPPAAEPRPVHIDALYTLMPCDASNASSRVATSKVLRAVDDEESLSLRATMNRILDLPDLIGLAKPLKKTGNLRGALKHARLPSPISDGVILSNQPGLQSTPRPPSSTVQTYAPLIYGPGSNDAGSISSSPLSSDSNNWLARAHLPSPPLSSAPRFLSDVTDLHRGETNHSNQAESDVDSRLLYHPSASESMHAVVPEAFQTFSSTPPAVYNISTSSPIDTHGEHDAVATFDEFEARRHLTQFHVDGSFHILPDNFPGCCDGLPLPHLQTFEDDASQHVQSELILPFQTPILSAPSASAPRSSSECANPSCMRGHPLPHTPPSTAFQLPRFARTSVQSIGPRRLLPTLVAAPSTRGQPESLELAQTPEASPCPALLDHPNPWQALSYILGLPPSSSRAYPPDLLRTQDRRGVGHRGPPPSTPPFISWDACGADADEPDGVAGQTELATCEDYEVDGLPISGEDADIPDEEWSLEDDSISDYTDAQTPAVDDEVEGSLEEFVSAHDLFTIPPLTEGDIRHLDSTSLMSRGKPALSDDSIPPSLDLAPAFDTGVKRPVPDMDDQEDVQYVTLLDNVVVDKDFQATLPSRALPDAWEDASITSMDMGAAANEALELFSDVEDDC